MNSYVEVYLRKMSWNAAGGTAILYKNADQVINDLKKLGL